MGKKKLINNCIAIVAVAAMGLSALPAGVPVDAANVAKISKTNLSITVGKSKTLKISGKKVKSVSWKSSKTKVASVKKKNKTTVTVKAKVKGKATVKATVKFTNGKKKVLSCKVTVKGKDVPVTMAPSTATPVVTTTPVQTTQAPTVAPSTATPVPTDSGPTPIPELDLNNLAVANYPTIFSDVPDNDMIRVGGNYYMVSTTMNMTPGAPIMKSTDLVNWQIVNYVYDTYADDDRCNLENGKDVYRNGQWEIGRAHV